MPDFDIDFCMDRRDEVIAYVQRKYGEASVGQIATFAELKSKSVVKDVARCLGITPVEAQQIANLIPRKTPAESYTIAEALDVEPKLDVYKRQGVVGALAADLRGAFEAVERDLAISDIDPAMRNANNELSLIHI